MKVLRFVVFMLHYCWQIVRSTWQMARIVLSPRVRLRPLVVEVPLELRGEFARYLFACFITMTPGSLSLGLDRRRDILEVHLLDAPDGDEAVRAIKEELEKPLLRVFGGGQQQDSEP
jgi:multisubunit Na+/H+ antiporter MnhE subunit